MVQYNREFTNRLWAEQECYFAASETLLLDQWNARPLVFKITENVARLLSPLLLCRLRDGEHGNGLWNPIRGYNIVCCWYLIPCEEADCCLAKQKFLP